jgi:DNA (cytosine-5)-methyltransferase 1
MGHPALSGLEERKFSAQRGGALRHEGSTALPAGPLQPWRELAWLDCSDGKRRPTQPGLFPLAPRYSGRVAVVRPREGVEGSSEEVRQISAIGALRAGGNAISPQVAATFIQAFLDVINPE